MDLRKNRDVLTLTFEWALQDREAMLDAVGCDRQAAENVRKEIRAVTRLRDQLLPDYKSRYDVLTQNARPVSIAELRRMVASGEIENRADSDGDLTAGKGN